MSFVCINLKKKVLKEKGKEIPENKGPGSEWNKLKKYGDRKGW